MEVLQTIGRGHGILFILLFSISLTISKQIQPNTTVILNRSKT